MTSSARVILVLDFSGSMHYHLDSLKRAVHDVIKRNSGFKFTCIAFNLVAKIVPDVLSIRFEEHEYRNTDILRAMSLTTFECEKHSEDEIIIIFVSDGADNCNRDISSKIKQFCHPLNEKMYLFTVAVGADFPTSLVAETLHPVFHKGPLGMPLVFPVVHPGEHEIRLADIMRVIQKRHVYSSQTFLEGLLPRENMEYCMNQHMLSLVKCSGLHESMACIKQARDEFKIIENTYLASKPSRVDRATFLEDLNCLRQKLNALQTSVETGVIMRNMSNAQKQDLLSYGLKVTNTTAKALTYKAADFEKSKESLKTFIVKYKSEPEDIALRYEEENQAEMILSAMEYVDDIDGKTIYSLMDSVDWIGRAIRIETYQGTSMNASLLTVKDCADTNSLYTNFLTETRLANLLGQEPKYNMFLLPDCIVKSQCGKHLTSALLCENADLFHWDAPLSVVSAGMVYAMLNNKSELLDKLRNTHKILENSQYLQWVQGPEFKHALTTDVCKHLNRFLAAVAMLPLNMKEMQDRLIAALVEFVGRASEFHGPKAFLDKFPVFWEFTADGTCDMLEIDMSYRGKDLKQFGLTIEIICNVFNHISGHAIPFDFLSILKLGTMVANSRERAQMDIKTVTYDLLVADIKKSSKFREAQQFAIQKALAAKRELQYSTHRAGTAIFKPEYIDQYEEENPGCNIRKIFQISEVTGLSRNACMCPGCDQFLVPMKGYKQGTKMSNELITHLMDTGFFIPGLTLALKQNRLLGNNPNDIKDGKHLLQEITYERAASTTQTKTKQRGASTIQKKTKQIARASQKDSVEDSVRAVEAFYREPYWNTYEKFKADIDKAIRAEGDSS